MNTLKKYFKEKAVSNFLLKYPALVNSQNSLHLIHNYRLLGEALLAQEISKYKFTTPSCFTLRDVFTSINYTYTVSTKLLSFNDTLDIIYTHKIHMIFIGWLYNQNILLSILAKILMKDMVIEMIKNHSKYVEIK